LGSVESSPRPRGRHEEARRNDVTLLAAARIIFALNGPAAPVSAIAEEAGVGIASLYRRYPTKTALLEHLCSESLDQQILAAEAALDPSGEGLGGFIRACVGFRAGVLSSLAGSIDPTPGLIAKAKRVHALVRELIGRAQKAQEARPDLTATDVHQLIELFSRRRRDVDPERLLVMTLDGLRPGGAELPRATATWDEWYARPWGGRV
jgi:AcrR family transcriptional regulator